MTDFKFTATHEWLRLENDLYTIGITMHAQELLGDMVFVELPEIGKEVKAGDELGVVESVKAASDFYAPISGTVVEVNLRASETPELLNTSPYVEGWLVKLRPVDPSELNNLLDEAQYNQKIVEENE